MHPSLGFVVPSRLGDLAFSTGAGGLPVVSASDTAAFLEAVNTYRGQTEPYKAKSGADILAVKLVDVTRQSGADGPDWMFADRLLKLLQEQGYNILLQQNQDPGYIDSRPEFRVAAVKPEDTTGVIAAASVPAAVFPPLPVPSQIARYNQQQAQLKQQEELKRQQEQLQLEQQKVKAEQERLAQQQKTAEQQAQQDLLKQQQEQLKKQQDLVQQQIQQLQDLQAQQQRQDVRQKQDQAAKPADTSTDKFPLYAGLGVATLGIIFLATRKS